MRYLMLAGFFFVFLPAAFCQTDTTHYDLVEKVKGLPVTYTRPEILAHYPYGQDSLDAFLRENLPAEWHSHYMTNLYIVVQFIVKQDSTLSGFTFVSGNKKLLESAIKTLKLSEPWIPGIDKSKSIQSFVKLKVVFPQPG